MPLTFKDLYPVAPRVNLCATDPRFADICNRAHQVLLDHGSWWGTEMEANFAVLDSCIVLPGCVAALVGLRACNRAVNIENEWYRLTPGFNPQAYTECSMWWEYRDNVPTWQQIPADGGKFIRTIASASSDYGKTIKFIGYDRNGTWVRTRQNGLYQDGEVVTLANPYADTLTQFKSVTAVIKDETDSTVRVFYYANGTPSDLTPLATYDYWETRPSFQRFRIVGYDQMSQANCCPQKQVTARVKLAFIKVKYDDDLFLIQNRQAMEYAVQAVKAIDDGNNALADTLLYGSRDNLRIGAIPLLEQELRTHTGDRFTGNVRIPGNQAIKRAMCGFV